MYGTIILFILSVAILTSWCHPPSPRCADGTQVHLGKNCDHSAGCVRVKMSCFDIDVTGGELVTEFSMSSDGTNDQHCSSGCLLGDINLRTRMPRSGKERYFNHAVSTAF